MDQTLYFKSHPPRCISGFRAVATQLPEFEFDGHASVSQLMADGPHRVPIEGPEHINLVFALSCPCGGELFVIHCFRWINPDYGNMTVSLSPLVLECSACAKMLDLLDTDLHGYDAELGAGSASARAEGEPVKYECSNCGKKSLLAFVRFEYTDDLFDGDFPEFAGREQDLFTWFTLVGKCPQCFRDFAVADFECA